MNMKKVPFIVLVLLGAALILAACSPCETPTPITIVETVEVPITMEPEEAVEVPFLELWKGSGHADASAEAFRHWDEDDPQEIPISCAKCHSEYGYLDFIGADGSEAGVVNQAAPIGSVITCVTCHNDATMQIDSVVMPSGLELSGLGNESRCMQCHQGRESTVSVNARIEEAGVEDDVVSEDLGFANIHYYAAAASKYGTLAKGGYEYEGKTYDENFPHVDAYDTCIECHDPHTLEVEVAECTTCHTGVSEVEDLKDVRMPGSLVDFDDDGDLEEGIYYEIVGLQEKLYAAIQAYATEVVGTPVVYDPFAYPHFFIDTNANGAADEAEATYPNKYASWTPRLLKATYNYQVSQKDPGGFAHGGKYIIQLLWDSTEDLNSVLSAPVGLTGAHRINHGHFAGSEEAFRHWDDDEPPTVPASCSRCHSAEGLPVYLTEGVSITQPISNGFTCSTCHNDLTTWTRYEAGPVTFPSGATVDSGDANMNLCMNCHQGRESGASVDRALAGLPADTVSESIRFINTHYFPAGAIIFGTEVQGGYEYPGKTYVGRFEHVGPYSTCTACHDTHQLTVKAEQCGACHEGIESVEDLENIRISTVDYDDDGDSAEGLAGEIATMREALHAAIQAYAEGTGNPIVYDAHTYPYFFADTDGDGQPGPGEANYGNRYQAWTPRLLKAAYNYQYATKDPGAFAHNGKYTLELLYDSIQDLGGSVAGMVRP